MQTIIEEAAEQCGIDLAANPLVSEFVQFVVRHVQRLPDPERSDSLRAVADAIRDESPNRNERVANVLFSQGGAT